MEKIKPNVFLRFNRDSEDSRICLIKWFEIFKDYNILLQCDIYDYQGMPSYLREYEFTIVKTWYRPLDFPFDSSSLNQACSTLTCFFNCFDEYFWLIDADDTKFFTEDYEDLRNRLSKAEDIFIEQKLDGFSLDFYREILFDHWSFGVCLMSHDIDLTLLDKINENDWEFHTKESRKRREVLPNIDSYFDILRKRKKLNLKSFIFDDLTFQHTLQHKSFDRDLPNGIYTWKDRKLTTMKSRDLDNKIKDDIISI